MSTRPIKVNFIVNLLSPMTRIVVALVTVPLYLHHIGDARFGVMSIVWVLLGLFGFLDLGLSRAVTNALAKLRDAPQAHRARVLLTTFGLNLGMGVLGGVVLYVFGGLMLKHFVSMPDSISAEVSWSLPWIACLLPLTLISAAGAGALESRELFLLVNSIQIFTTTLAQVAPIVAAIFISPSLTVVIPTAAVSQGLGAIVVLAVVYRLEGPFSLRAIDWGEARKLLQYGGWMFASQVIYPAVASADQFIIGSVAGVAAVAHYSVPMSLVQRSAAIPTAFGRTLFPRLSSLSGDAAHALGTRALSMMAFGFAAICAPAIILSHTFFRYWIGADFAAAAAPVAQVLFPGMWMGALSLVCFTLLQSQGRADVTGKIEHGRIRAVYRDPVELNDRFWDCRRGCRVDLAMHGGCACDALAFRNEKRGFSSLVAPRRAFSGRPGHGSLPRLQPYHNLYGRGVHRRCVICPRLSVFRRLARAYAGAGESSARFPRQPDPGQADAPRQRAKMTRVER